MTYQVLEQTSMRLIVFLGIKRDNFIFSPVIVHCCMQDGTFSCWHLKIDKICGGPNFLLKIIPVVV